MSSYFTLILFEDGDNEPFKLLKLSGMVDYLEVRNQINKHSILASWDPAFQPQIIYKAIHNQADHCSFDFNLPREIEWVGEERHPVFFTSRGKLSGIK